MIDAKPWTPQSKPQNTYFALSLSQSQSHLVQIILDLAQKLYIVQIVFIYSSKTSALSISTSSASFMPLFPLQTVISSLRTIYNLRARALQFGLGWPDFRVQPGSSLTTGTPLLCHRTASACWINENTTPWMCNTPSWQRERERAGILKGLSTQLLRMTSLTRNLDSWLLPPFSQLVRVRCDR